MAQDQQLRGLNPGRLATYPLLEKGRRFMRLLLALAMVLSPMIAHAQTEPRGTPALQVRGKYIDERVAEFMAANDVPGMTMAIVQAPYIPRSAGYGRASLQHDELA